MDDYEARGVDLTSFSVYVPTASSEQVLGTRSGRTFYYTTSTSASFRVDDQKDFVKTSDNDTMWNNFVRGAVDIAIGYADWQISIPYTVFSLVVDIPGDPSFTVKAGSYLMYTYNVSTVTRLIYTYNSNGKKVNVRSDQYGNADFFINFAPVGTGYSHAFYEIKRVLNQRVAVSSYYDTSAILTQCNAYYNRKAFVSHKLSEYSMFHAFR